MNWPVNPVIRAASSHVSTKKALECWFVERIEAAGLFDADQRAKQLLILLDGAITQMLTHRDIAYADAAAAAAINCLGLLSPANRTQRLAS